MTADMIWMNDSVTQYIDATAWSHRKRYRIHLLIEKDDAESYSASALNLPGAGSCGSTEEESINNAKEAVLAAIEEYISSGVDIPWDNTSVTDIPSGASHKWVIVDA